MRKSIFLLLLIVPRTSLFAQEFFPEGTKWTEIKLDTTKYDSWYSKVGDEWVPNFETVEYYVKGEYEYEGAIPLKKSKCVYSSESQDSVAFLIQELYKEIFITYINNNNNVPCPATVYRFNEWVAGMTLTYRDIEHSNITSSFPYWKKYGNIVELNDADFGGIKHLTYADLDTGRRIIHGIGVTEWPSWNCLFGPADILTYMAWNMNDEIFFKVFPISKLFHRSMLVHFERDGEVLYNVWPEPGKENTIGRPAPSPSLVREGIFDLQGRKLPKAPQKGIFIQDGKKTIIR